MHDRSVVLDKVRLYWEHAGADVDHAHEIYHDDAVLEFPQSGERFEGVDNFTEWRRRYPAEVRYRVRRITTREDLVVAEVSARVPYICHRNGRSSLLRQPGKRCQTLH